MKQNSKTVILIPARINSSRFPKKVLTDIDGKPLIINVLERAKKSGITDECYVACCCDEVKSVVEQYGGKAILTDPELPSGTDRIFEASKQIDLDDMDILINLQGDIPIFDENILVETLNVIKNDESIDISTPVIKIKEPHKIQDKNCVKVVFKNMEHNKSGKAFYFSRDPIPNGSTEFFAHIGIYAYRYHSIKKFVSLEQSYLEKTECLEQLRALENNMNIHAVPVDGFSFSVDVVEDLKAIQNFISGKNINLT